MTYREFLRRGSRSLFALMVVAFSTVPALPQPAEIPTVIAIPSYPEESRNRHLESRLSCTIAVSPEGEASLGDCEGVVIAATVRGPKEVRGVSRDQTDALKEAVASWRFPPGSARQLEWHFRFELLPALGTNVLPLPLNGPVLSEVRLPDRMIIRAHRKELRRSH